MGKQRKPKQSDFTDQSGLTDFDRYYEAMERYDNESDIEFESKREEDNNDNEPTSE